MRTQPFISSMTRDYFLDSERYPQKNYGLIPYSISTLLIGSAIGANIAVSQSQQIFGCVSKKTGLLRMSEICKKEERSI